MMRKSIFDGDTSLRYAEGYSGAEDYKLWTTLAIGGYRFANIPEVLLRYRSSSTQMTEQYIEQMSDAAFRIQIEYTTQIIKQITEKEKRYYDFFNQLIGLANEGLISAEGLFQTVYHIFVQFLDKEKNLLQNK